MQQMLPGWIASQRVTLEHGFIRALPSGVSTMLPAGLPSAAKFTAAPPCGPEGAGAEDASHVTARGKRKGLAGRAGARSAGGRTRVAAGLRLPGRWDELGQGPDRERQL